MEDKNNSLDQVALANRLMEQLTTINKEETSEFINEIDRQLKEEVVKVPEPVFRSIFLPVFTGEVKQNQRDFIAHWMGVVGGPSSEGVVVDLEGNELFKVPPIYDTEKILTERREGKQYASIFSALEDDVKVFPQRAAQEFSESASGKISSQTTESERGLQGWKKILQHYGFLKDDAAPVGKTTGAASIEDDFDFS